MSRIIVVVVACVILVPSLNIIVYNAEAPAMDPNNLASPFVSFRFVQNSQNIDINELNALRDIYFYVSILNITGDLGDINTTKKQDIINTLQSSQNSDGGFGDWFRDRSKAGSTRLALETLRMLNAAPYNVSNAVDFISRLQVSGLAYGNYGFRSSIKETDADVSSTYDALISLDILGAVIPNRTGVVEYLKDHQNFDGGFGFQTNRQSGIFWRSTVVHTFRGLLALELLNEQPTFIAEAKDFLRNLQRTNGGFATEPEDDAWVSYTFDAVVALRSIGESIPRTGDIINFIGNNRLSNGGYIEYDLDTKAGLHTTYYAIKTLSLLNAQFNGSSAVSFAEKFLNERLDGGFGDYPGLSSTARFTFDAASVLNLIGREPLDRTGTLQFIQSLKNPDGGYGADDKSNAETTYRAIMTLQSLGEPIPHVIKTAQFLRSCQNYDGGFGFSQNFVSRGSYTYRSIRALSLLGYEPINVHGAIDYLRSLQNADGGFGNFYGEAESDLGSTYYAIRGLAILGSGPLDTDLAERFIKDSQNPDGGFRRSPSDTNAPRNFSRSLFTYDAVLSLHFLAKTAPNIEKLYDYIISLRNPDLGYADQAFFTSSVSSTFTSLWIYFYLFSDIFDTPPNIFDGQVNPSSGSSKELFNFTIQYHDLEGQRPEYVHLVLDGFRYVMYPLNKTTSTYFFNTDLPVGDHWYHFIASDGIFQNQTATSAINVPALGSPPAIELSVSPEEGTEDTNFVFSATFSDTEGDSAEYVRIKIDNEDWIDMKKGVGDTYSHVISLKPGVHVALAKCADSLDMVTSELLLLPVVYTPNATRPDWDIFLKIQDLIKRIYDVKIKYSDVTRSTYEGELAWKVDVEGEDVFVSYDGTKILSDNNDDESLSLEYLMIIIMIVIILAIVLLFIRKNRKG